MAHYYLCLFIFRIILPLIIGVCVAFRPTGLSALYLLYLLVLPLVPVPTVSSMSGSTGLYLKFLIAISFVTAVAQLSFQIVVLSMQPYGHFIKNCEFLEKLLRNIGFVRLDDMEALDVVTWLFPEIVMLLTSVAMYVTCSKLLKRRVLEVVENEENLPRKAKSEKKPFKLLVALGKYAVLATFCVAAVLRPSVPGGLYFLVFLSAATWWACCRKLRKGFAITMRCLMVVTTLHLFVLYAYQFQWPQEFLERNATYARYFGLRSMYTFNCTEPRTFFWANEEWATYVNPLAVFLLYYVMALESKFLLKPRSKKRQGTFSRLEDSFRGKLSRQASQRLSNKQLTRGSSSRTRWQSATRKVRNSRSSIRIGEKTPLMRGVSPHYGVGGKRGGSLYQDSTGSFTVAGENADDIPMDQLEEEYKPTVVENVMFALESVVQVVIKSSYIATNIIMMAWSITYLSWITFVLLLWANLLWLVPNQRKSMLRSSPFLVVYAWFLLISAYVYSMDLTEEELPVKIEGINLAQVGFVKIDVLPCNPLLMKCLFTGMFWITLRQYARERREERQNTALAQMVAPLQVTVGTAAGVDNEQDPSSRFMEKVGKCLRKVLTKFWIWVVALTLFGVAITGERMTVFRIIYMALFLIFILSFQLSFRSWRRIMFAFWLTVIVYSMIILVMVYTYQFDHFKDYWRDYLHIPEEQQLDIGLEQFDTKQLFVRLVTPTFFVIIAVVQLHYFHKDFMEMTDPKNAAIVVADLDQSSLQGGAVNSSEKDEPNSSSLKIDLTDTDNSYSRLKIWGRHLRYAVNVAFLFLELHMPKIVLLFLMLLCVHDKCAIYLVLVILIVMGCTIGRPMQIFAIYSSSVIVSVMLLARMLYQIQYIDPGKWNTTCELDNNTKIENNAGWLGFDKTDATMKLPQLVKWNIVYVMVVSLFSVILIRQFNYRLSRGKPTTRAFFMFPKVTRTDADKDLSTFVKYLMNYGFYKFGVEICLMATVAVIGFRMDLYSVLYSVWLCALYALKRETLAKVWNFYQMFIILLLPIQYFMAVGLPPSLCILFPWDPLYWGEGHAALHEIYRRLQEWAYLLDSDYPPSSKKLILDFVLLLLVSRQSVVFRIERRWAGRIYPGGSNESIIHHAEEKDFVNPVPDYISKVRSYLDVFKNAVFSSFLWITLAIVFLAGTNRVNLFSIGYLVGAFIFLWQGTDLYLRPVPKILKRWDMFLGYNVFVILCKSTLQIVGCVFIRDIRVAGCWVIQLLGIGCVRKFGDVTVAAGLQQDQECKVPREFMGLAWDGLCFGFMLTQRRLFQSYNFFHLVDEIKAATILASRGAELIEELRLKRMTDQEEQERRILEKIKAKMDKIKANQQKIQGSSYKGSENHYIDTLFKGRPKRRRTEPKSKQEAIRSGDYYMFDDLDDDEELDFIKEQQPEEGENKARRRTISEIEEPTTKTVTIMEEPQPGTSKDEDDDTDAIETKETIIQKVKIGLEFIWAFVQSAMVSLTNFLNRYSRDYRYVLRVLAKEKRILKDNTDYTIGLRLGTAQVWQPAASYDSLLRQSRRDVSEGEMDDYDAAEMSSYDQPPIIRLLLAVWHIVMSRSENVCYFIIFLNQIKSATFLSLPLPLMVFFWGTLTIPRPNKTFWVTIIAYTEAIVLIKCMFQFEIIPWNQNQAMTSYPFYPPRIIGIEKNANYAVWDLLLLMVVFFHRFMLKSMGLWKTSAPVTAVLLTSGDYNVTSDHKLEPVEDPTDPKKRDSPEQKTSSTKRGSDLERLVEESEDQYDEKRDDLDDEKRDDLEHRMVTVHTESAGYISELPESMKLALIKYGEGIWAFFRQLRDPTSRVAADVYSYMFLCDFYNFFVILIGYSSFGTQQGDGGVSSYLEDNRVPVLFLLMLILQFMLIIVDRGIFLRKNIVAKIIFQFIQVVILHVWLFIIFPVITERGFNTVIPPQMYYMVKCFYLLLSAYQIRCGYPTRILGNFLCKGYNYVNLFLFKGFMAVPFLFELRTVMDWMWTDTSMTVFDWIKMEDIFAHIFQLKCSRHVEDEYPQARGERKSPSVKYFMGGCILFLIIAIIWFPLVFFSLGNAVGRPNPPYDVTLEIRIGPYQPVYQMSAQNNSIYQFTDGDLTALQNTYIQQKTAATFISTYEAADITAVILSADSANVWSISPPDRDRMVEEVGGPKELSVRLEYKVAHKTSKPEDSGVIPDGVEIKVPATIDGKPNPMRQNLLNMLKGDVKAAPMVLPRILPKFLKITNRGTAKPVTQLMFKDDDDIVSAEPEGVAFRTISLTVSKSGNVEWWMITEDCSDFNYKKFLHRIPYADCDNIILYTFNDKIFPSTLSLLTAGGIVGLYTTLVFVASRFLRGFFADQCFKIMFEDMPNIDRVFQLCLDIYLVREAREFALEEDLFAKLVFLFRSPETMIKWTRPKEELDDDEDPEGNA